MTSEFLEVFNRYPSKSELALAVPEHFNLGAVWSSLRGRFPCLKEFLVQMIDTLAHTYCNVTHIQANSIGLQKDDLSSIKNILTNCRTLKVLDLRGNRAFSRPAEVMNQLEAHMKELLRNTLVLVEIESILTTFRGSPTSPSGRICHEIPEPAQPPIDWSLHFSIQPYHEERFVPDSHLVSTAVDVVKKWCANDDFHLLFDPVQMVNAERNLAVASREVKDAVALIRERPPLVLRKRAKREDERGNTDTPWCEILEAWARYVVVDNGVPVRLLEDTSSVEFVEAVKKQKDGMLMKGSKGGREDAPYQELRWAGRWLLKRKCIQDDLIKDPSKTLHRI